MVDKVRPLKQEHPDLGGTETDIRPKATDPTEDHLAAKGIAFENSDDSIIYGDDGVITFKDTEVTDAVTLEDLALTRLEVHYLRTAMSNLVERFRKINDLLEEVVSG